MQQQGQQGNTREDVLSFHINLLDIYTYRTNYLKKVKAVLYWTVERNSWKFHECEIILCEHKRRSEYTLKVETHISRKQCLKTTRNALQTYLACRLTTNYFYRHLTVSEKNLVKPTSSVLLRLTQWGLTESNNDYTSLKTLHQFKRVINL